MVPVQVRVTRKILDDIEKVVNAGEYSSRSELVREALRKHLKSRY